MDPGEQIAPERTWLWPAGCIAGSLAFLALMSSQLITSFGPHPTQDTMMAMGRVQQGLEMYAAKHKTCLPTTAEGLAAVAPLLPDGRAPTDAWGNPILYYQPPDGPCSRALIRSLGADGRQGGRGADADLLWWRGGSPSWDLENE